MDEDVIFLEGLEIEAIIGINDWERVTKQKVIIDFRVPARVREAAASDRIEDARNYKSIAKSISAFIEASRYQLVETLAERVCEHCIKEFSLPWIWLRLNKSEAIRGSKAVGVEIRRSARDYGA